MQVVISRWRCPTHRSRRRLALPEVVFRIDHGPPAACTNRASVALNDVRVGFQKWHSPLRGARARVHGSIIMTTRHDATAFCELDSCLDRLRAALSTHLYTLCEYGFDKDAEVLLVEWNPCTGTNTAAAHCHRPGDHGRGSGFLSLSEAVKKFVTPSECQIPVRVLTVGSELHGEVFNPGNRTMMEWLAKNAAARRARGEYLLYTNPDDIWSDGLGMFLGQRRLRADTAYSTFKSDIWIDVPLSSQLSKTISPRSMLNFAQRTAERSPRQLQTGRYHYRRAACPRGRGVEAGLGGTPPPAHGADSGGDVDNGGDDDDEPLFVSGSEDAAPIFTVAAGDFFLVSRHIVHTVRGYSECGQGLNMDGLFTMAVAAHGFGLLVLGDGCEVIHQDHECFLSCPAAVAGSPPFAPNYLKMLDLGPLANLRPVHVSLEPHHSQEEDALDLTRWNGVDWGLSRQVLPETRLWSTCS